MSDTTYIELLKLAHEQLDSQAVKIAGLEKKCKSRSYTIIEYSNRIAELEEKNDELNSTSDELYSIVFNHIALTLEFPDQVDHTDIKQLLEAHNLEQQAKGIIDVLDEDEITHDGWVSVEFLQDCIDDYQCQAKALKGTK
jgi:hypothetical protein